MACTLAKEGQFTECVLGMLQAHQQPEAGTRCQMHPANAASLTRQGPGLPRTPLSQASLNTPQAFASSSGSPAPSTTSTNTGEILRGCHDCMPTLCATCPQQCFAPCLICRQLANFQCSYELLLQGSVVFLQPPDVPRMPRRFPESVIASHTMTPFADAYRVLIHLTSKSESFPPGPCSDTEFLEHVG